MAELLLFLCADQGRGQFFPLCCRSKSLEVEEGTAVQGCVGNPHDSTQTRQGFFIHLVSAEQVEVIAEVPQEPAELPHGLGGAVEPSGDALPDMFFRLEDAEAQGEEGLLRMPAIEDALDPNQEESLQGVASVRGNLMQTWDVALHDFASSHCA